MFSAWLAGAARYVKAGGPGSRYFGRVSFLNVEANTALEKLQSDPSTPLLVDGRVLVQFLLAGQRDWHAWVLRACIAPQGDHRGGQERSRTHRHPVRTAPRPSSDRRNPAHERLALLLTPPPATRASSVILADDRRTSRGTQSSGLTTRSRPTKPRHKT